MDRKNSETTMYNAVDFEFFVEYYNSLTSEELAVSTIDFEKLGILWGGLDEFYISGKSSWT